MPAGPHCCFRPGKRAASSASAAGALAARALRRHVNAAIAVLTISPHSAARTVRLIPRQIFAAAAGKRRAEPGPSGGVKIA
jgi:hypothetical protein